jgi:hypothetical protein
MAQSLVSQPEPPSYDQLVEAWRSLAAGGLVQLEEYMVGNPQRLLLSARIGDPSLPSVMIAAGVHGDEPVTSWALLDAVRDHLLDPQFSYRLWCCTNPTGYALGTRQNFDGLDINRSYVDPPLTLEAATILEVCKNEHYRFLFDMHEDFESDGVYLYEPQGVDHFMLGRRVLEAIQCAGYPLQHFDHQFDLGYPADCADEMRRLEPGLVVPNVPNECAYFADGLPLTMYCLKNKIAAHTITLESPRCFSWHDRMAIHRIALVHALSGLNQALYTGA